MKVLGNKHFTFFLTGVLLLCVEFSTMTVFGEAETGSAEEQPVEE
jgi:hypothetical protein